MKQAIKPRDYIHIMVGSADVFGGIVYAHTTAEPSPSPDFVLRINEPSENVYHLAVETSIDFPAGSDKKIFSDGERKLVERLLNIHRTLQIPLTTLLDPHQAEFVRCLYNGFGCSDDFMKHIDTPRGLVLELYTAYMVAMQSGPGVVLLRQPYEVYEQDGSGSQKRFASDIDVALITTRERAVATLASIQSSPRNTMILNSPALIERIEKLRQRPYDRAA